MRHVFNINQIKNRYCDIMLVHVIISFFNSIHDWAFATITSHSLLFGNIPVCLHMSLYVLMPNAFYICPFIVSTIMTAHSYVWILVNIEQIQFLNIIIFATSTLTFFRNRVARVLPLEMEFAVIIVVARFLDSTFIQKRLLMINLVVTNWGVLELID